MVIISYNGHCFHVLEALKKNLQNNYYPMLKSKSNQVNSFPCSIESLIYSIKHHKTLKIYLRRLKFQGTFHNLLTFQGNMVNTTAIINWIV